MKSSKILLLSLFVAVVFSSLFFPLSAQASFTKIQCRVPFSNDKSGIMRDVQTLEGLLDVLKDTGNPDRDIWAGLLQKYVGPTVRPKNPYVTLAFVGPANVGKTTAFNAVVNWLRRSQRDQGQDPIDSDPEGAPVYGVSSLEPGSTRRDVILKSPDLPADDLMARFGTVKLWERADETTNESYPLYINAPEIPPRIVVMDTAGIMEGRHFTKEVGMTAQGLRAYRTLQTSEILFILFSMHETGNFYYLSKIKEALDVWGHREVILGFQVDRAASEAEVTREITRVARQIDPEFEMSKVGGPETNIIATYKFPYETEVFQGKKTPGLEPIGPTLPFPELMGALNRDADIVWENVFKNAIRAVATGARSELLEVSRRQLELRLLKAAVELMVLESARVVVNEFDYADVRNTVHGYWRSMGPELNAKLRENSDFTARPELVIFNPIKRFFGWGRKKNAEEANYDELLRQSVQADELVRVNSALENLSTALTTGDVTVNSQLVRDPNAASYVREILEIDAQLRELAPSDAFVTELPEGGIQIELGRYSKFPLEIARKIREALSNGGLKSHNEEVLGRLRTYQPPLKRDASLSLVHHLREVKKDLPWTARVKDEIYPLFHFVVPWTVVGLEAYSHWQTNGLWGFLNPISLPFIIAGYAFSANIAARIPYGIDRSFVDGIVKPAAQDWYASEMQGAFRTYVDKHIMGPLHVEIRREEENLGMTEGNVRDYMKVVDRLLENTETVRPLSLRDSVVEGAAAENALTIFQQSSPSSEGAPASKSRWRWWKAKGHPDNQPEGE